MKILVTGGYGFIGSHLCEKLSKERHQVFVIDDLSASACTTLDAPHAFYRRDIAAAECETIFQNNNIDVVIHLAAAPRETNDQPAHAQQCGQTNLLGLLNMLRLSAQYGVKKFIFLSSAAVYGNLDGRLDETLPLPAQPQSLYALDKQSGEAYCRLWREQHGLNTVILRLASVYGPRQRFDGTFGDLLRQAANRRELTLHGAADSCVDYLYIDDAVMAIYQSAVKLLATPLLNVAGGTSHSALALAELLTREQQLPPLRQEKNRTLPGCRHHIDIAIAKDQLAWSPRYTLEQGLRLTLDWLAAQPALQQPPQSNSPSQFAAFRPYLENAVFFAIAGALSYLNLHGGLFDFRLGMDYNYIYIAIMGLLYGKQQSLPATALSAVLFYVSMSAKGADIITLLYQVQYLTHLAAYLALGVVTGYISDRRRHELNEQRLECARLAEQQRFLQQMHQECVKIKDDLYHQIVNSDDSIGKVYNIVKSLDSLAPEDIYTAAVDVLKTILRSDAVDIYTVSADRAFWRIKMRSKADAPYLANSIRIADSSHAQQVMASPGVFVNRQAAGPSMSAPIRGRDGVIAVVQIYNLPFESMTLHHSNLLRVTALLIADALSKAQLYEASSSENMHLAGTQLLLAEPFAKLRRDMVRRSQQHDHPFALLRVTAAADDFSALSHALANTVRTEDYAGFDEAGNVLLLLPNIQPDQLAPVQQRLLAAGCTTIDITGDELND